MKVRKTLVRYIVIKNLPFNTVEDSYLEEMLGQGSHSRFEKFYQWTSNMIFIESKKNLISFFQMLILEFILLMIFEHLNWKWHT